MRRVPDQNAEHPRELYRILTVTSPEFSVAALSNVNSTGGSTSWPSANDPILFRFRLSYPSVVKQLGICHGSSAGNNFDVGIYDESLARLISTGSTLATGNNLWQFVDVADTSLQAMKVYYLAGVRDNATANRTRQIAGPSSTSAQQLAGSLISATDQFPLPNPITNTVAATFTGCHLLGMAMMVPFA